MRQGVGLRVEGTGLMTGKVRGTLMRLILFGLSSFMLDIEQADKTEREHGKTEYC